MKELSDQARLVVAVVLSVMVVGVWGYLYRPKPSPPGQPEAQKSAPAPTGAQPAAAPGAAAAGGAAGAPVTIAATLTPSQPAVRAAATEQMLTVVGPLFRVELSNHGASVHSWQLLKYKDETGKTLDVVHPAVAQQSGGWPLMLVLDDRQQETAANSGFYEMSPAAGIVHAPAEVKFDWSDGHLAVSKRLKFSDDYIVTIETSVALDGKPLAHGISWRGSFGDATAFAAADQIQVVHSLNGSVTEIAAKKAGDSKNPEQRASVSGTSDFAGIVDHYFAAAFLPDGGPGVTLQHWKFDREVEVEGKKETEAVAEFAASAPNAAPLKLRLYVGPKEVDALARVRPPLTDLVRFGSLGIIARPLFDFLKWIHRYVSNYGWAIVLMTIAINMVLFPLKYRSFHQMMKMQKCQPEIKQIQDRYKKYSLRDPRRQEMNKEVMAVYSREGVNPMGGCLPTVIQMPIWFALYRMLDVAIELRQAPWLGWVKDLSARDPYYILPILMCVTMYLMQKMTPVTTSDPAQQKMLTYMPLFMGFLFLRLASGLVLYILTSNIVGTAQQWFLMRGTSAGGENGGNGKRSEKEKKRK